MALIKIKVTQVIAITVNVQPIMYKKFFLFVTCLFAVEALYSQVNLQTGAAEQDFPLISYADNKNGLTLGVSAHYSSGNGLLVKEVASNLGTGWSLDAGGMISRIQIGYPDDQAEFSTGKQTGIEALGNYPNGYLYSNNIGQGCNAQLNYYPVFNSNTVYRNKNSVNSDTEQDRFVFKFGNRAGVFIIGRDGKVTTLGDTRTKINFTTRDMTGEGIRTRIEEFIVTTEDGVKYSFKTKGLARLLRYKYYEVSPDGTLRPLTGNPSTDWYAVNRFWGEELQISERPYVVSSWFLTQIENTNTGAVINFEYESVSNDIITGVNVMQPRDLNNTGKIRDLFANSDRIKAGRYWNSVLSDPQNAALYSWNLNYLNKIDPGPLFLTYMRSITKSYRLSRIVLPNGAQIKLTYSTLPRADLSSESALSKVEYILNGSLIRGYKFEHGYFYRNTIRAFDYNFSPFEKKFARLCLLSIQKIGNESDNAAEPPYKFAYYTGTKGDDIVPARNFLAVDHWGYYNGDASGLPLTEDHDFFSDAKNNYFKTVLPARHNPKSGLAKNGLLRSITYPTGGTLEYFYDQNKPSRSILPYTTTQLAGGVSVSKTVLFDGESHAKDIINEFAYIQSNGVSSRWGDETPEYTTLSVTEYNEKFFKKLYNKPGLDYPEMAVSTDASKFILNLLLGTAIGVAVNVGIELALVAMNAAAAIPYVNMVVAVLAITKILIDLTKTFEFHRFVLSNSNNIMLNPLSAMFSRVEVRSNSPNGYNGKTVYEYTDNNDYPLFVPQLKWPYIQSQRAASWAYGLLKRVTVFDKDNKVISQKSNIYTNWRKRKYRYLEKIADANNINCKCATQNKRSMAEPKWKDDDENRWTWSKVHWMTPIAYYSFTGRVDLLATNEKNYVHGNLFNYNEINFVTDPASLILKGTTVKKDMNSLIVKLNYVANDFDLPGAIQTLKARNAIHTPVSSETWLIKLGASSSEKFLLNSEVTEYQLYTFGNGRQEVKPWRTYTLKTKTPIPESLIGMHSRTALLRQPAYYKQTSEMFYDADGNLTQTVSDGQVTSYVYDNAGQYLVATATNANYSDIAYTSFEATNGQWDYDTRYIKSFEGGLTGDSYYELLNGTGSGVTTKVSRIGLNSAKTYVVTYWTTSTNLTVNGQVGELLFTGTGGWKLFKNEISNTTTAEIAGSGLIDEVRLYPKGALMSTAAYKHGIGKTAECDANNRLLFYEYDALGRLKLIRDQLKNVIKTYEYNYKK